MELMIQTDLPERSQIIENNLGLVHSCANRFRGRGVEYDDLFQAGCVGLVKAADGFDFSRGLRFSTYAVPVILGEIKRIFRDGGSVKVSRSLKELSVKAGRIRESILQEHGREPLVSEIAAALGIDEETAAQAIGASMPTVSLTESEDEGSGQIDIAVDSHEDTVVDTLALKEALSTLGAEDRQMIILRYFKNETQAQVAKKLGMTQVQVSRREKKLLAIMRKFLLE